MHDDRVSTSDLNKFVARACLNECDACACARPKGHDGLHRCGSSTNRCPRWTDEDSERWWAEFRRDL